MDIVMDQYSGRLLPPNERVVWVANWAGQDLYDARRFGVTRYVTEGSVDVFHTEELMAKIEETLARSVDGDYLLLCGSVVVSALCAVVWVRKHQGLRVLIYGQRDKRYVAREVG